MFMGYTTASCLRFSSMKANFFSSGSDNGFLNCEDSTATVAAVPITPVARP